jgi:hypothetical protein
MSPSNTLPTTTAQGIAGWTKKLRDKQVAVADALAQEVHELLVQGKLHGLPDAQFAVAERL